MSYNKLLIKALILSVLVGGYSFANDLYMGDEGNPPFGSHLYWGNCFRDGAIDVSGRQDLNNGMIQNLVTVWRDRPVYGPTRIDFSDTVFSDQNLEL